MQRLLLLAVLLTLALPSSSVALTQIFTDDLNLVGVGPDEDSDVYQPATAYNPIDDHYLVVWSEDANDSDFRLQSGILEAGVEGAAAIVTGYFDAGSGQARQPAAAFDPSTGLYLVVWSQDADAAGAFEIHGRFLDTANLPVGPVFKISEAGTDPLAPAFDALDPDVVADGHGSFLVVWAADDDRDGFGDGDFELRSRMIQAGVTSPSSPTSLLTNISSSGANQQSALHPALAHYPDVDQWVLLFEFDADPGPAYSANVNFGVLQSDGSVLSSKKGPDAFQLTGRGGSIAKSLPTYFKAPDVAFDRRERQFLAIWETNVSGEPRIVGRRILSDYSLGPTIEDYSAVSTGPNTVCIARDAAVTYSFATGRFLVAWSGSPFSGPFCPGLREIVAREVERDGAPLGAAPTVISNMSAGVDGTKTAVSPALIASDQGHRGLLATWSGDPSVIGDFALFGQYLTMDVATAVGDGPQRAFVLDLGAAPNPFNPSTVVSFEVPKAGPVRLDIYDVRGAKVRTLVDEPRTAGRHQVRWTGTDHRGRSVASGVYFVRLTHDSGTMTQKVALVE